MSTYSAKMLTFWLIEISKTLFGFWFKKIRVIITTFVFFDNKTVKPIILVYLNQLFALCAARAIHCGDVTLLSIWRTHVPRRPLRPFTVQVIASPFPAKLNIGGRQLSDKNSRN